MSKATTIALRADPDDPEDFDVTEEAMEQALAERRERLARRDVERAAVAQPATVALDDDVLAKFRATGPGWQARVNEALRAADPVARDGDRDAA